MADWSGIKRAINDTLGSTSFKPLNALLTDLQTQVTSRVTNLNTTLNSRISTINSRLGSANPSTSGTGSVMSYLKKIAETPGVVKSVQRGVVAGNRNGSDVYVSISSVTPSKSMVILNSAALSNGGNYVSSATFTYGCRLVSFSANGLSLTSPIMGNSASSASWQVIEFY